MHLRCRQQYLTRHTDETRQAYLLSRNSERVRVPRRNRLRQLQGANRKIRRRHSPDLMYRRLNGTLLSTTPRDDRRTLPTPPRTPSKEPTRPTTTRPHQESKQNRSRILRRRRSQGPCTVSASCRPVTLPSWKERKTSPSERLQSCPGRLKACPSPRRPSSKPRGS